MSVPMLGSALHRPAVSHDGRYIAIITSSQELQLIKIVDSNHSTVLFQGNPPKISSNFLTHLNVLRWAPPASTAESSTSLPWLLMSDGSRLLVINPDRLLELAQNLGYNSTAFIAAEYDLKGQFGKPTYVDFVLSGHHVLVLFEASSEATILSTVRPHSDAIHSVKFPNARSVAKSPTNDTISLLLRSQGQDQLVLLRSRPQDGMASAQAWINLPTADAQGALFCPGQDPVIAAWDSAAYGMKVHFFSAMGHSLKAIDITSFGLSSGLEGVGLSQIRWARCADGTVLAVANGAKQILIRHQSNRSMFTRERSLLTHPPTIDGTKSIVWQQAGEKDFTLQKGVFDAVQEPATGGDFSFLELNCDSSFLVSTVLDNPRTVWIWQPEHPEPHTVVTFIDTVRSLAWHPTHASVLVLMTSNKAGPSVFCWHVESRPPTRCHISLPGTGSLKFEAAWLTEAVDGRHPLVLSSTRGISYGFLQQHDGLVDFHSVLQDIGLHVPDDEDMLQQTPSKPAKKPQMLHDVDEW